MDVLHLVANYTDAPKLAIGPDPVVGIARLEDGSFELTVTVFGTDDKGKIVAPSATIPVIVDHVPTPAEMKLAGRPLWSLKKLAPTAWTLTGIPIGLSKQYAFYVTFTDAPDPAPWENAKIVLAS